MKSHAVPPAFLDERKALACVHCGLCLSSCPTYLESGNENDSPRGRIHLMRAIQEGRLGLNDTTVRHLDLCLGCRACESACPSGVQYGDLIEATRDHIEHTHRRSWGERVLRRGLIEWVLPHPWRMSLLLWPARMVRRFGWQRFLPERWRALIDLLPTTDGLGTEAQRFYATRAAVRRGRVGLVTGCVMSVLYQRTHQSTIRLLTAAGYDVVLPRGQGCCGALYAHGGNLEAARNAARQNAGAFGTDSLDAIVVNAAGCGSTLKEYGSLLSGDDRWRAAGKAFAIKVRDLTEILVDSGELLARLAQAGAGRSERVTCHDACHLAHAQRITEPPRRLIRAVAGTHFVELPEADVCCGSAGSYNLTQPVMAQRLQERKIRHLASLGPVTVVTTNPGCVLQIQAGLRRAGMEATRVEHIADWLAKHLGEELS